MLKNTLLSLGLILITYTSYAQVKSDVIVYKSVKGHDIKANIFLPQNNGKHPVVIYFHGGGFIFGNRDQGLDNELKNKLLANNYAVVSADYRLAPETKLAEILTDVRDMVVWMKTNGSQKYSIDTSKIAVSGGSSGGYLALSSGFNHEYAPAAIVAISTPTGFDISNISMGDLAILKQPGPYDIVKDTIVSYGDYSGRMELWRFLARNWLALYEIFGFDPDIEREKLKSYTLTNNIKSGYPPTLLLHAKTDRLIYVGEVTAFYNYLQANKIDSKLYLVENGHSSELINQNPDALDEIVSFLNEQFKKENP